MNDDERRAIEADCGRLIRLYASGPLMGRYTDRLVRIGEGWCFAERVGGLDFRP